MLGRVARQKANCLEGTAMQDLEWGERKPQGSVSFQFRAIALAVIDPLSCGVLGKVRLLFWVYKNIFSLLLSG